MSLLKSMNWRLIRPLLALSWLFITSCSSDGTGSNPMPAPPPAALPSSETLVKLAAPAPLTLAACNDAALTGLISDDVLQKVSGAALKAAPLPTTLRVHYQRSAGDYAGWGMHLWNLVGSAADTTGIEWNSPLLASGSDSFGQYFDITLTADNGTIGYIFHNGNDKDHGGADQQYVIASVREIWRKQGDASTYETNPDLIVVTDADHVRVHYKRYLGDYAGYGLHIWETANGADIDNARLPAGVNISDWSNPVPFVAPMTSGTDSFGVWTDIPVKNYSAGARGFNFLIHKGTDDAGKDGSDRLTTFVNGYEIWLVEGDNNVYYALPNGDLSPNSAKAFWVDRDTIIWPRVSSDGDFRLHYSGHGGMNVSGGVTGAEGFFGLTAMDSSSLSPELLERFKFVVKPFIVLKLPSLTDATRSRLLRVQTLLVRSVGPAATDATQLQIPGVLDDMYAASAANQSLGVVMASGVPQFHLWAPTAISTAVCVYDAGNTGSASSVQALTRDDSTGIWHGNGSAGMAGKYYRYIVDVYVRSTGAITRNLITDPYSVSLSADSRRSWIGALNDASVKPSGWDAQAIPALDAPEDLSIYETHVRDFSSKDSSVSAANRGKFLAFTENASAGMQHLIALQQAGLTMVHLLPVNDMSTVPERDCVNPAIPAAAADSDEQQAAVNAQRDNDCFNWGYDPLHYTALEGSYATDPSDGAVRVKEFRQAVQALHTDGLRVALDVVYNHTPASGQDNKSILDKIVPGYYHRLDSSGNVTNSTCCSNTATEHAMMAKLMIDSVVTLATQYKVDAFRFDIMGHQPLAVMNALQTAVNTAAGRSIYLYGEGWNFGEVANDARFVQATQRNLAGSGIGSFNDRIRDAARGGGAFDGGNSLIRNQGLINGIFLDDNGSGGNKNINDLFWVSDMVRLGTAATLRDYEFVVSDNSTKRGDQVDYYGQGAGYTLDPQEVINYVDKHDNQTLYDINGYKLPLTTSMADRVRVQALGFATVTLSQGVPFYHAGMDILRSKSYDRDSYNSGDHFNGIDWSLASNNYGAGAPVADKNSDNWSLIKPRLADTAMKPDASAAIASNAAFRELLQIRHSSTLFRLRTGDDVKTRLHMLNTGTSQVPGVIAYSIDGAGYSGANFSKVVVIFNVDKQDRAVTMTQFIGDNLSLHPVQAAGTDAVVKTSVFDSTTGAFSVPARTVAVYVLP